MKSDKTEASGLESELLRLNELVRARRKQLARLDTCPHKDCECRAVWHEVVDKNLSAQVGNIRRGVRGNNSKKTAQPKKAAKKAKRA